ncbi:MAG TPA: hypothetical protein VJZ68_06870 [Nitrososphaera sp.]|jgi:hypothetical protein|nr:hypothetical protein [Nitrososphaera sp.]
MSATSSKSRLVLFLLVVIALVFFITSFVAAAFTNSVNTGSSQQVSCTIVRTGEEKMFGECGAP